MKTLLNLKNPEKIYYCDKPLTQAETADIKLLSCQAISEMMAKRRGIPSFNWSEDFIVPDFWSLTEEDKRIIADLRAKMVPQEKFIVCFINETVGYGVFAREEIQEGSIALYGGEKMLDFTTSLYQISFKDMTVLDALKSGAHAQLFQDLYTNSAVLTNNFSHIASNNFISKTLQLSCGELTYFRKKSYEY